MRVTSKGQVTIPIEIREQVGLLPGTEVEFEIDGAAVRLTRSEKAPTRGRMIVDRLRGRATTTLTTEEIIELTRR